MLPQLLTLIKPIARVHRSLFLIASHLESAVNSERCPAVSIRTRSHCKACDILFRICSSLSGDLGDSPIPFKIDLDPLPSIVLFSWPSSLEATLWFQVESCPECSVIFISFARGLHRFIWDFSRGQPEGFRDSFFACGISKRVENIRDSVYYDH